MIIFCNIHGETKHIVNNRKHKDKVYEGFLCSKCAYNAVKRYRKALKIKAVEYKGGKCSIPSCGYSTCIEALEFHHTDPAEKDFSISSNFNKSWEKIKNELDKCIMVCANCHREIHYELREMGGDNEQKD